VQQCMEWCDSYALPLVVPLTTWLPDPRPALVTTVVTVGGGGGGGDVVRLAPTVSAQHVFCADGAEHAVSMYHVPSGKHIRTFTGKRCGQKNDVTRPAAMFFGEAKRRPQRLLLF